MTLDRLAAALGDARVEGSLVREITAVVHDSRSVKPGALFVALRGARTDGAAYVGDAIARGAAAVVIDEAHAASLLPLPQGATALVVRNEAHALSRLAATFYGAPSRELQVIGVTGTNGKTTTTHLIAAILERAGIPTGRIGTLGAYFADAMWPLDNTTPPADELQRTLAAMRDRGARAVALEVSSHALALGRVADVHVTAGVFTNVTRDHLDFHASLDAYAAAKRSLFERAEHCILNVDDVHGATWSAQLQAAGRDVLTYGTAPDAAVRADDVALGVDGSTFRIGARTFRLPLPGRFNVSNALAAIGTARVLGVDDETSAVALRGVGGVPGRMQRVGSGSFEVFVDYAHTPDALEHVLRAARELAKGRVIVVFGCGGDRDRGKRPQLGRVGGALADVAIVTSDNPRSEDPEAIVAEIAAGVAGGAHLGIVVDRRLAIREAVAAAQAGDVVVVAGKGHEAYQAIGERVSRFDDAEEVRAALADRSAVP
jgi:UDP-N-acetylmuramoyl-L-alanyl-D-glutamate--2,6-diaminopimelate ligase